MRPIKSTSGSDGIAKVAAKGAVQEALKTVAKAAVAPLPLPVERGLKKLGNDVSLARRRRHISQASFAERIGASISTVRRMEQGDARIPIHFLARAMHVFGLLNDLTQLLDTPKDEIGLTLVDSNLPQRVRGKSKSNTSLGAL
jgi:DNA-binding transcriptional regulator YiaG